MNLDCVQKNNFMLSKLKFDCVARLGGVELLLEPPRLLCEGVHLRLARGKLTVFCTDISARHLQFKLLQKLPSPHKIKLNQKKNIHWTCLF